jgi:hypothetical protein
MKGTFNSEILLLKLSSLAKAENSDRERGSNGMCLNVTCKITNICLCKEEAMCQIQAAVSDVRERWSYNPTH